MEHEKLQKSMAILFKWRIRLFRQAGRRMDRYPLEQALALALVSSNVL
jgi:hypothetical protein